VAIIETPASVSRKIELLDGYFEQLARSYAQDASTQETVTQYRVWRDKVKGSLSSSFFPSTVADEYEQWQQRYVDTFNAAKKRYPNVITSAPLPDVVVKPPAPASPWVYAIVAGSVALGLVAIAWMKK
jgi:hypothetical protein